MVKMKSPDKNQYYTLKDPLNIKRWMCGRCGLIFDYQFDLDDDQPGWPAFDPPLYVSEQWEDEQGNIHFEEPERRELCPRCGADFSVDRFIPITVSKYDFGEIKKLTFFVEDDCHATVVQQLALQLNKDVMVVKAGNSSNVKNYLKLLKEQGTSANAYFMVDGDNEEPDKHFASEQNYIHLDRYCIESYLFDASVISAMTGKSKSAIRHALIKTLKNTSRNSTKKHPMAGRLLLRLLEEDVGEEILMYLDTSEILQPFFQEIEISNRDKYIEMYVKQAATMSKLGRVFPPRLVKAIRSSKHRM